MQANLLTFTRAYGVCLRLFAGFSRMCGLAPMACAAARAETRVPSRQGYGPPGASDRSVDVGAQTCLGDRRAGRLIGSQGPEFAQQCRQRLGGALEELNRIVSEFDAEVRGQNLTPPRV
jgi:Protein of unknown function (DUF2937)